MTGFNYVGGELDLFSAAHRWKAYLRARIAPYLGSDVLEVGAGFGGTTRFLCAGGRGRWICLEPDAALAARAAGSITGGELPTCCEVVVGTIDRLAGGPAFDTILYIDVLEHIEDDVGELARAAALVRPGGHVIALSPAHPWLFTPFDRAIGHHRRYTRRTLTALTPAGILDLIRLEYLDAVGLLASLGNKVVLNRSMPTPAQVATWDRLMVPLSRLVDPALGHRLGKSILGVWRRPGSADRSW